MHPAWNWNGETWWHQHEEGLQLHDWNEIVMSNGNIQQLMQIMFHNDGAYRDVSVNDVTRAIERSTNEGTVRWKRMKTHLSKYVGWQAECTHCGALCWAAWKPASTMGWRDHQRANIVHFLGLAVPPALRGPLEDTLPMV